MENFTFVINEDTQVVYKFKTGRDFNVQYHLHDAIVRDSSLDGIYFAYSSVQKEKVYLIIREGILSSLINFETIGVEASRVRISPKTLLEQIFELKYIRYQDKELYG